MARLRLFLLFIGLLILNPSPSLSAEDSTAPYIYYYANIANAIVVERADGTDSRLIAPGVMPPDHTVIADLDWSPSGQWMAWRSAVNNGYGSGAFRGWITRSDGSDRLTMLDDIGAILTLKWSPTDDLLYVAYAAPGRLLKLTIIDPNANAIIAQTEFQDDSALWIEGFPTGWIADGSGISYSLRFDNTILSGQLSITNQTSNRISTSSQNTPSFLVNLFNGRLLSYEPFYDNGQQLRLTMRDLSTKKSILIDLQSLESFNQNPSGFQVYWNPTMTHALILEWACADIDSYCIYPDIPKSHLYLLDWGAGTLQSLAARVHISNYYDTPSIGQYPSTLWSPDGHHVLLRDELNHFIIVDVTTGELFPSVNLPSVGGWRWAEHSDALIFYSYLGRRFYRYDLKQRTLSLLDVTIPRYSWFSVSPDGRFVGLINRYAGDVTAPDMFDLKTRGKRRWPHHSLGSSAGPILEYLWHPNSRWFMTAEWSALAGGPGPSSVMVLDTAGDVRRELSVCGRIGYCTGFVPDRALPHLGEGSPHSVITEPLLSLPHQGRVIGVAWNSDGTKIASYSVNSASALKGNFNIWDVSEEPVLLTSRQTELDLGYFSLGTNMTWDADGDIIRMDSNQFQQTLWRADTGGFLETMAVSNERHPLFTLEERNLTLWDGDEMRTLILPFGNVMSVDANLNSPIIVGAGYAHRIFVWDAKTGEQLPDVNFYARAVALSPDGTRLAAAGSSLVTIWDTSEFAP